MHGGARVLVCVVIACIGDILVAGEERYKRNCFFDEKYKGFVEDETY